MIRRALKCLVAPLDPAGQVDRGAQRAVFELADRAGVSYPSRAGIQTDPQVKFLAQDRLPASNQLGELLEHVECGSAGQGRLIGLLSGSAPHGHQLVADVVDEDALVGQDGVGQDAHHVVNPLHGLGRPELIADPAETPDIAEEEGDLTLSSLEKVGILLELFGQVGREELLELDPGRHGRLLMPETFEPGGYPSGQELDEHGLDLGDITSLAGFAWLRNDRSP